jgi:hypothetical protein
VTCPYRLLTTFALCVLVGGCGGGGEASPGAGVALDQLPPPLVGLQTPVTARAAADPADWQLPDDVADPAPWFRLFFVQDNRAEMEACGCPGAPTGGLARRSTFGEDWRALFSDAVLVEGPNSLSRAVVGIEQLRGEHRSRGRQVLQLLRSWKPAAFFPGQADLAVVPLPELGRLASFPVVVSNLEEPGAHGTLDSLLVQVDDRRILLLGLVRPAVSEAARTRLALRPAPGATRQVVEAAGAVDLVVAFTDASLRDLTTWFEAGLDVDVLVAPPAPGQEGQTTWRGDTLLVYSQPSGRSVQRLDVLFHGGPGRGLRANSAHGGALAQVARQEEQYLHQRRRLDGLQAEVLAGRDPRVRLTKEGEEERFDPRTDPDAVRAGLAELKALRARLSGGLPASGAGGHSASALKMTVRAELAEDATVVQALDEFGVRRLTEIGETIAASTAESRYLGHEACVDCHTGHQGAWARTDHARAWGTLLERGEERNPECLACHSTGFGAPGGFADPDRARHLVGVQCEACHGPMEVHAGQARKTGFRPDRGQPVTEATCLRCHDPLNSPRFDFDTYAPRVAHPGSRRKP